MSDSPASDKDNARIPPQDLEAEKSLLGALLLSDAAFPNVLEQLKAPDFYDPRHADIYKGMISLYEHHRPIDLMTLTSELKNQKTLKNIGGAPYLTELTNFVPTASHVDAYADLVAQAALRAIPVVATAKSAPDIRRAPSAISRAVASLTAPWRSRVPGSTPSTFIFDSLL